MIFKSKNNLEKRYLIAKLAIKDEIILFLKPRAKEPRSRKERYQFIKQSKKT